MAIRGLLRAATSILIVGLCGAPWITADADIHLCKRDSDSAALAESQAEVGCQGPGEPLDEVEVTSTRVQRTGYEAPTPTSVLGKDELELRAPGTLADALALLPSMRAPQDEGTGSFIFGVGVGRGFVNLRGLGPDRTLVLLDGQRLDGNTLSGQPDLTLLPSALISRVDVVTGGASAAYGSGAVAGIINIILDSNFTGFKANLSGGISSVGDAPQRKIELAWGDNLSERLHVVTSLEYFRRNGLGVPSRDFATPSALVPNPSYSPGNGQKPLTLVGNAYDANESYGGLILNGPLVGQAFTPNGDLVPYAPATCTVSLPYLLCNSRQNLASALGAATLAAPEQRANIFGRLSFDITPDIRARFDALYASHQSSITSIPFSSSILQVDVPIEVAQNAYLPTGVRNELLGAGQSTLLLGRFNQDEGAFQDANREQETRLSAAIDATFPHGWKLNAYTAFTRADSDDRWLNDYSIGRFLQAVDSVIVNSTPICRVNANVVAQPACAPANIFGAGNMSTAAKGYFLGTVDNPLMTSQIAAGVNLSGEPFSTWAAPVSAAVGAEFRHDTADQRNSDPQGIYAFDGVPQFTGSTAVKEAYAEIVAVLAKDALLAKSLDLDAAVRRSDYSQSGTSTTWKLGLNYMPLTSLRFRATSSHDIRAPSIGELDTPRFLSSFSTQINPQPNGVPLFNALGIPPGGTISIRELDGGNSSLTPERSATTSAGIVVQPSILSAFTASIDYYYINITNAIADVSPGAIIQNCAAGSQAQCALISHPANSTVPLVVAGSVNSQSFATSGFDIESDYHFRVADGDATVRAIGNYIRDYRLAIADEPVQQLAGDLGSGLPRLQADLSATYRLGGLGYALSGTYISGGDYDKTEDPLIENDHVSHVWYVGATLERSIRIDGSNCILYAHVANLLNQKPPSPGFGIVSSLNNGIFTGVPYDRYGTYLTLGVRVEF